MEMTGRTLRSRLICLLLALCITAGFVPLIDYSAFAVDNVTTIGELEQDVPRSGNGWSWDGAGKLNLFGTELKSKDDDTPKISYSGEVLEINVLGYNRAVGDSLLAACSETVEISGSGILECDSKSALLVCNSVNIRNTLIKAPDATLVKDTGKNTLLNFYDAYLEIGTINTGNTVMQGGVIDCEQLQLDGNCSSIFDAFRGVVYAEKASAVNGEQACTIYCQTGSIFKVNSTEAATPTDLLIKQIGISIVMVGDDNATVESEYSPSVVNGMKVYCKEVSDAVTIDANSVVSGVYYTADINIGDGVTISDAAYFAGNAVFGRYNTGFTIARYATVAGAKNLSSYSPAVVSTSATVCFDGSVYLYNTTVEGSVYGGLTDQGGMKLKVEGSEIETDGSIYALGYSQFTSSDINGSATVYGTSVNSAMYGDGLNVNGTLSIYDSNGSDRKDVMGLSGGLTISENAEISIYMPYDGGLCGNTRAFDVAVGSSAFYSAADLGDEYRATVSIDTLNCGKLVYVGKEGGKLEPRFDTAFKVKERYWANNGHGSITRSLLLSLDPADDHKALLAYDCTHDIDFDDVKVTITRGAEDYTSGFDIKLSHYFYTDMDYDDVPDDTIARSLSVEISATKDLKLVAGDEYKVTIEYDGITAAEIIEVTGVNTTLNFTGEYDCAPNNWSYDGVDFSDVNTDYEGDSKTWAWYANGNTKLGYPAKTLVLNGIDFASNRTNAIIVPAGSTIILKGENKLFSSASAIRANGDLTIIGEGGGCLTAISSELSPSSFPEYEFDAVIKAYGYDYVSKNILIKDAKLDLTAKKAAAVTSDTASNKNFANCYCISGDTVIIDNSEITANAGLAGSDVLKSACIAANNDIILKGETKLDLTSEQYALYAVKGIKSLELNRLEGADGCSLDAFNSALKDNNNAYAAPISGTSVRLETKPVEQLDDVKTADILDPDAGVQTMLLSDYFSGGTNSYIFELAEDVTLPDWITLTQDGTLTLNTPDTDYAGGVYKLLVMDDDTDLRNDPLEFELTVGKIGRTVDLTVDFDVTLGTVTPRTCKVLVGEDTTITIEAKDGRYIDSVMLDGTPAELTASKKTTAGRITSGTYTIENISADHTVSVIFKEIPTCNVTVSQSGSGTITSETEALVGRPDFTYLEGTDVVISAAAADGFRIKSVTLDGAEVTLTEGKYTIKCITANCTFAVEFEEIPKYQFTVNSGENGTVTVETAGLQGLPDYTYYDGTEVSVTITPDAGYVIKTVKLGDTSVSVNNGKLIFSISSNCTLEVEFEKKSSGGSSSGGSSSVELTQRNIGTTDISTNSNPAADA